MKCFQIKIISESILPFQLKVKKVKISPAVFLIVCGCFHNVLVDFGKCSGICDSKELQQSGGFGLAPAIIVNTDIEE